MRHFKKLALAAAIVLTAASASTMAEAGYRCAWNNNVRVCWYENNTNYYHVYSRDSYRYRVYSRENYYNNYNRCYWVKGHWYHGYWRSGYRVCR